MPCYYLRCKKENGVVQFKKVIADDPYKAIESLLPTKEYVRIRSLTDDEQNLLNDYTHNSDMAEMLCSIMKRLEETVQCPKCGFGMDLLPCHPNQSESIREWWEEHKKRDNNNGN